MREDPKGLAGISTPSTFPLLFKFLDANKVLFCTSTPQR